MRAQPDTSSWLPAFVKVAAIGTLADVVPLVGENRIIAKLGLGMLSKGPHKVGLRALLDVCGLTGKKIDSYHIGFIVAPRVNAAGRMSTPDIAARLLLAADEAMAEEARALAEQLDAENMRRRRKKPTSSPQARKIVETDPEVGSRTVLVVAGEGWHRGVIGIVASKMVDAFYRPAIVLSIDGDVAHGSCRSIPGSTCWRRSSRARDVMPKFGGHKQAYVVTMVGETNRAPFDMPESEGDLVGGFNTEYSSIKFAMFMLAEYVNMVTVSAVSVTLFLGGWRAPYPISTFWEGANHGWWPMLWFVIKVQLLLFFFIWLRGTLPRVRYDQLMKLGWKVLIPVSVVWLMLVATVRALRNEGYDFSKIVLYVAGAVIAILLISFVADIFRDRKAKAVEAEAGPEPAFDPMAGGFPVPPLPGQTLPPVPRRRPRRERELVVSGGPDTQGDETASGGRTSDGKEADGV